MIDIPDEIQVERIFIIDVRKWVFLGACAALGFMIGYAYQLSRINRERIEEMEFESRVMKRQLWGELDIMREHAKEVESRVRAIEFEGIAGGYAPKADAMEPEAVGKLPAVPAAVQANDAVQEVREEAGNPIFE